VIRRGVVTALATSVLAAGLFVSGPAPVHAQSRALVDIVGQIQQLPVTDFVNLVGWAEYGVAVQPSTSFSHVKATILSLDDKDRQAVLSWLRSNGRSALYARGMSDDQIGPPRAPLDSPAPSASP
jgi:hypothetical protein